LQIYPPVQHPAVDSQNMCVLPSAHESLARWSVHNNLGKTVFEVVQRLMREPPTLLPASATPSMPAASPSPAVPLANTQPRNISGSSVPPPAYPGLTNPSSSSSSASSSSPSNNAQTALPSVPSSFTELNNKTTGELSALMSDEGELLRFFDSLSSVQTIKTLKEDVKKSYDDTLRNISVKEAQAEKLKRDMQQRQLLTTEKRKELDKYLAKQNEVMKQFSTSSLIEKLGEAASTAEAQSEQCAVRFLNGNMELKDFVREFSLLRETYHLRAAKKESLTMLQR